MIGKASLTVNLRHYGQISEDKKENFYVGGVNINQTNGIYEVFADILCTGLPYDYAVVFDSNPAAFIDINIIGAVDGVLSREQYNPFWSRPSFETDLSKIPDNVQNMLIKQKNVYTAILPICTDDCNAYLSPSDNKSVLRLSVTKFYEGAKKIKIPVAVIAVSDKPYDAVHKAYEYAFKKKYIDTPLIEDKKMPEIFNGLGWCTWNAFYHEVNEEKIIAKVREFKKKNIPLKWIMIDGGWQQSNREKCTIMSFEEDRNKFPDGLSGCIKKIKAEGIEYVGVWHAMSGGYWYGVDKESELYNNLKGMLIQTNSGYYIPDENHIYDYYNQWFAYLKAQGVDFVKTDGQGIVTEHLKGMKDCVKKAIGIQKEFDRAVWDNFGGNVMNCMGMSNINAHHRPFSSVSRNSDDFYPLKKGSFISHIQQNLYNSVFHGNLYYTDFDMWWTNHEDAKLSGILRQMSGGPVYISDKLGETKGEYLTPLINENGMLNIPKKPLRIADEYLFGNNGIIKVENNIEGQAVTAIFNLTENTVKVDGDISIAPHDAVTIKEMHKKDEELINHII